MVYNSAKVKTPPTSFAELTGPQWKGQVGMNDPSQSGPTFPLFAGMMNSLGGVSAGEAYFTRLKDNGLVIHPTNGPTLQALTSGQINVALVQSSAGVGAALSDKKLVVEYLKPATLLPSAIGIDASLTAWARGVLPVVSRPLVMAWLLTFCGVFLELPISQLLYQPGSPPASVAIQDNLGNYHFGLGLAQAVLAVAVALAAVGLALGLYRLAAPAGWRRIGRRPWST